MKDGTGFMFFMTSANIVLLIVRSIATKSFDVIDYTSSILLMLYAMRDYFASKKK